MHPRWLPQSELGVREYAVGRSSSPAGRLALLVARALGALARLGVGLARAFLILDETVPSSTPVRLLAR